MTAASLLMLLAIAVSLALRPWAIMASVLLTTAPQGTRRAVAFAVGWMFALTAVAVVTVLFAPRHTSSSSSKALDVLDVVIGLLLCGWFFRQRRRARRDPKSADGGQQVPGWMARVQRMPAPLAFCAGVFLPSYIFVFAAVSEMLHVGLSKASLVLAGVAFVLIASAGVVAAPAVGLVRRDRADAIYERWRVWLVTNSAAIVLWSAAGIGVLLTVKGLVGLLTGT